MPQLGETVAEGTVMTWHKDVGDEVAVGELLFEVATDKVDTEVEATAAGVLREILVPAGETVPVGTPLAVLGDDAEPADARAEVPASPAAQVVAEASDAAVPPPEHGSTDVPAPPPPPAEAPAAHRPNTRHHASPLVRRLAREAGLDVTTLTGTGPAGRVVRADVAAALQAPDAGPDVSLRSSGVSAPERQAHGLATVEVDVHGVDAVRRAAGLDLLPFVARAVLMALADHPRLHGEPGDADGGHRPVHLGLVAGGADAPSVRVVPDAGDLRLPALGRRLAQETDAGVEATFTISDGSGYGAVVVAPVLAPPRVAALAVGAVRPRPVAVQSADGSYAIAVHPVCTLALAFDPIAVADGDAAAFLHRTQQVLETRDWPAEL